MSGGSDLTRQSVWHTHEWEMAESCARCGTRRPLSRSSKILCGWCLEPPASCADWPAHFELVMELVHGSQMGEKLTICAECGTRHPKQAPKCSCCREAPTSCVDWPVHFGLVQERVHACQR